MKSLLRMRRETVQQFESTKAFVHLAYYVTECIICNLYLFLHRRRKIISSDNQRILWHYTVYFMTLHSVFYGITQRI